MACAVGDLKSWLCLSKSVRAFEWTSARVCRQPIHTFFLLAYLISIGVYTLLFHQCFSTMQFFAYSLWMLRWWRLSWRKHSTICWWFKISVVNVCFRSIWSSANDIVDNLGNNKEEEPNAKWAFLVDLVLGLTYKIPLFGAQLVQPGWIICRM